MTAKPLSTLQRSHLARYSDRLPALYGEGGRWVRLPAMKAFLATATVVVLAGTALSGQPPAATVFEGAQLIVGDGRAPIERGAFVVQKGRVTAVGQRGSVRVPSNATRVDLTGKTVMPAIVNAH